MAKTILYPAYAAYIMAPTARQANELFNKIRDIAMRNLQTIAGNDVFLGETIKTNGNATGFVTASGDPHVDLYNDYYFSHSHEPSPCLISGSIT